MKTTKINLLLLLLTLGMFAFTSCEDEFTEEDFLEMQAELAESQRAFDLEKLILEYSLIRENDSASMVFSQQLTAYVKELEAAQETENIEALRQAGLLASYTLTVEDQRGLPIEGATVSVGGNNAAGRIDATSDATGQAIVQDIVVGASPVQVTASGFVGVSYILDLGSINYGVDYFTMGDKIYPLGRHETIRVTLLSSDGASGTFSTVTGTATIETDLTNTTREIPQNATVVAYIDGASAGGAFYASSVSTYDFRFIGEGVGSASINNTTGAWSMQLPANEAGINYTFSYSEITADQTLAIQSRNGVAVSPEYAVVPTRFGPSANASYDGIPSVAGASVVFDAPPAQGTGFNLTFTQVARPLFTSTGDVTFDGAIEGSPDGSNTIFRLNNRGAGYSTSPNITVDGGNGTGTDASIVASINGRITGISVPTGGANYAVGDQLTIRVEPRNAGGSNVMPDSDPFTFGTQDYFDFTVTVNSIGLAGALPATLDLPSGSVLGVTTNAKFGFGVASYNVSVVANTGIGAGATLAVSGATASVDEIRFSNGGSGYTGPATITVSGGNGLGGSPTQASMSMGSMAFEYSIAPNNTSASGYRVLPGLRYEYTTNGGTVSKTDNITAYESDNSTINGSPTLSGAMELSSGTIVFRNTGLVHRTLFTRTAPVAEVVAVPAITATATVGINSTTGAVNGVFVSDAGRGYSAQFGATIVPTIAGAPGSGASVTIPNGSFNFDAASGEVTYNFGGVNFAGGSGYLPNLNRATFVSFTAPSSLSAVSGRTYVVEVFYGTGARTLVVD